MPWHRTGLSPPAIIVSDLDGTLLDHDSYAFDAALNALRAVRERGIPLILATSKTLAETMPINAALHNHQAVIVENGGVLCFPLDLALPFDIDDREALHGHALVRLAPPCQLVRDFIERERARHGWRLRGFADMDTAEVAKRTGLAPNAAELARQRLCSEPFVWRDSTEAFERFEAAANKAGLFVTRGGRFHHLMGGADKGEAMRVLQTMLATDKTIRTPVIALGDSENDRGMLEAADVAVVIRRHDGTHLDCRGLQSTLFTPQPGPAGWNTAVLQLLDQMTLQQPSP